MHAAHERIVYERLKRQYRDEGVARQPLLMPVAVNVTPAEADLVEDSQPLLEAMGLAVDRVGPEQLRLRGLPALRARACPRRGYRRRPPGPRPRAVPGHRSAAPGPRVADPATLRRTRTARSRHSHRPGRGRVPPGGGGNRRSAGCRGTAPHAWSDGH
ncbi:hypothetical protein [Spiribacter roseus]|uniref:hypothetical protein n=1 Tax=Spiribacter roseus TaxID=1855875 RepID=UPI002E0F4375